MELRKPSDLAVYVRLILSQKFFIGVIAFVTMLLTAFYVYFIAGMTYESQAKLLVQKPEFITTSPVSPEPVTVKTISSLLTDIALIGDLLDRMRSDRTSLILLAEWTDKKWKDHLPEISSKLAQIADATEILQKIPDGRIGPEQAARLANYSANDIQGILEADEKLLSKADPLKFRKELNVDLEVEQQTAYEIKYQPVATLRARLNTAKAATIFVKMWRDLFLERLQMTTRLVGGITAEDLSRKAKEAQQRWLIATEKISAFEAENNVATLQSEVDSLAATIKENLRPNYYQLLNSSASATANLNALRADLAKQSEGDVWIGNTIKDVTGANRILAYLSEVEAATLTRLRQSLEEIKLNAPMEESAPGMVNETTSELAMRITSLSDEIITKRSIVNKWKALDRVQQALVDFLYSTNLDAEKTELSEIINIINTNRNALNTAKTQLQSASASLEGIEARLKIEPPTKTVDDLLDNGEKVTKEIENSAYIQLQTQYSETAAERDAAVAEVRRITEALTSDMQRMLQLQQRVNQHQKIHADLQQRMEEARENFGTMHRDYITTLDMFLRAQRQVNIINTQIEKVLLNLRDMENRYRIRYSELSKFLDQLENLRAAALAEKQAYDAISAKYADAELVLKSRIDPVQKWGDPKEPRLRVSPKRTLSCLVAGFLSVIAAMAYIIIREIVEPSGVRS